MRRKARRKPPETVRLENDPRNGCVGCGPGNPRGLRLQFDRVGDVVRSRLPTDDTMQGWPDRVHTGVIYIAMLETAAWTIFAFQGEVGIPTWTGPLNVKRWVVTGETLTLRGRIRHLRGRRRTVAVEARDARDRLVATLERGYLIPTRREFLQRMGYRAVPPVYEDLVPSA